MSHRKAKDDHLSNMDVIFGGFDGSTEDSDCEFGIYVAPNGKEAVRLPAVTSSRDVVEKLKNLSLGQVFKVTSEQPSGPLGTRVNAVEVKPDAKIYTIPQDRPVFLKL